MLDQTHLGTIRSPVASEKGGRSDRLVFGKLVQVLVFGCAYERIADDSCSATTLRRRRDEWIASGAMENLRQMVLEAYERMIGLELSEVAVDCCITKAPCGGERAGRSPVDRAKQGIKRFTVVDANGIPLGAMTAPAVATTRRYWGDPGHPGGGRVATRADERPPRSRLRFEDYSRETKGPWPGAHDLREGQAGSAWGHGTLGGGAHELLAQRPQEAGVVYGKRSAGHRPLDGILRGSHHRRQAHTRSLESLLLGESTPA
jgi:hypothetical protein